MAWTARERIRVRELQKMDLPVPDPQPGTWIAQIRAFRVDFQAQEPTIEGQRLLRIRHNQAHVIDRVNLSHPEYLIRKGSRTRRASGWGGILRDLQFPQAPLSAT